MQMISGTIKSAVKLDALMGKWEEKKANKDWRKDSNLTEEERMICQFQEDLASMREGNKTEEIASKVYSGQRLSSEELDYLQKECPELYKDYMEIRNEREGYERKLKNCKTKEEVDRVKTNQMNQYAATAKKTFNNPNIPLGEKYRIARKLLAKITGVVEAEAEFKATKQYKDLESEHEIRRREHAQAQKSEEIAKELGDEFGKEFEDESSVSEETGEVQGVTSEHGGKANEELPSDAEGVVNLIADMWNEQRPIGVGAVCIDAGAILEDMKKKGL